MIALPKGDYTNRKKDTNSTFKKTVKVSNYDVNC